MQSMEVSIGFIEQDEAYLLQLRPNNPAIGAAGLIGAFGGRIEPGETSVEAVCRELSEETSLRPSTEDFSYLGRVEVTAFKQQEPIHVIADVFKIVIDTAESVMATDGDIVRITKQKVGDESERLTPATRAAFEQLL